MTAFPADPLPALTELLIDGAWTTATVREESGVDITRGRANETGRVAPSRLNATLDNRSTDYSNRLPTSVNYGKLGRNTQLRHRVRWVRDTFARTVSNGWGTSDTGQAWVTSGGSASDYAVGTGVGTHTLPTPAVTHASHFAMPVQVTDLTATVAASAVATGDHFYEEVMFGLDGNNCYNAQLQLRTGGTAWLTLVKVVAGVPSTIVAATQVGTYSAGTQWSLRLQRNALGYVRAAAWLKSSNPVATTWTMTSPTPETQLSDFSTGFVRSTSGPANTNVNPFFAWDNFEVNSYRFWGEVPSWPQTWESSGADVTAPIEAAGIMRRLGGNTRPLRSPLFRTMAGIAPGDYVPHAYWPMEDGSNATQFASGLAGGSALALATGVSPGSLAGPAGSETLATIAAGGSLPFAVPAYSSTQIAFQWFARIPSEPAAEMAVAEFYASSGPVRRWRVSIAPGTPAVLWLRDYDSSGTEINATGVNLAGASATNPSESDVFGHWVALLFAPEQIGADVHSWLGIAAGPPGGAPGIGNVDTGTLGTVTSGVLYGGESGCGIGHMGVYTDPAFDLGFSGVAPKANVAAMDGYDGELAADRMTRLCREESVTFELTGDASDTAAMGPQRSGKLLDLLFECADADLGILFEPRDAFGLAYRTLRSLYNQTGLALDYSASQVFEPFAPTEDDQLIVNDATARRPSGSWARVTEDSGPLSTQAPPDGVGPYAEDRTYNVATDGQLAPIAGWRVHLGTWDEARYPQVHVMLHAPAFSASAALTGQALAVDVGDYLSVDNPPAWLPPDLIELLAQGYRETHHTYELDITFNAVPAGPYRVFVLDQDRIEGDHALASSVTTSATSWSVKTLSGPLLSTTDTGQQWMCEGELVTVTAVSGGASPQTVTVTRSANGVVKAHGADAPVTLSPAPYLAL